MKGTEIIIKRIEDGRNKNKPLIIAIDGRCAAGKTSFAECVARKTGVSVVHMDDFFLQPFQRTEERLKTPGGNADRERFEREVLVPLSRGEQARFFPFDCHSLTFKDAVSVNGSNGVIVEGSYCCHPELWHFYDVHIFMDVDKSTQLERIKARNGADGLKVFEEKWIPLEEEYFSAYDLMNRCDYCFKT